MRGGEERWADEAKSISVEGLASSLPVFSLVAWGAFASSRPVARAFVCAVAGDLRGGGSWGLEFAWPPHDPSLALLCARWRRICGGWLFGVWGSLGLLALRRCGGRADITSLQGATAPAIERLLDAGARLLDDDRRHPPVWQRALHRRTINRVLYKSPLFLVVFSFLSCCS